MDCLAIHHFVKNRNIQTIPEAQKICKEKIKQLLREKIKGMRKEKSWMMYPPKEKKELCIEAYNQALTDLDHLLEEM